MGLDGDNHNIYKTESITPEEFIHRTLWHVLPGNMQKVRYYGLYSNKFRGQHKGMRKKAENDLKATMPSSWRRMLWQVFHVDPLTCLVCGTIMKVKAIYPSKRRTSTQDKAKGMMSMLGGGAGQGPPGMAA